MICTPLFLLLGLLAGVCAPSHEAPSHEAPSHEAPSHEAPSHEAPSHEEGTAAPDDALDLAIELAVQRELAHVVSLRRAIHAQPELGEQEVATAGLVARELRALGLEVREQVAVTGVVGILRGEKPGPLVAYRADMDALPIREETGLPYASTVEATWRGEKVSVMHACGHDMHTAIALGLARVLATPAVRRELRGSVMFVFQPAEESVPTPGTHGALRMLEEGLFAKAKPKAIFGLHVHPDLNVGQLSIHSGPAMAAVDRVTIEVEGQQSHGAYPHSGVDPIVAASHIVIALQTIASRNVDTHESVVLSIGRFHSGNRFNILPEKAELVGTLRTHDERVQARVHQRIREISEGVAASLEARATVEIMRTTPVTYNDPTLVARMLPVLVDAVGEENLIEEPPHMGGEDFAYFAREVPGLYYFLGTSDPERGVPGAIHTPNFQPDESALEVGMRTSLRLVLGGLEAE